MRSIRVKSGLPPAVVLTVCACLVSAAANANSTDDAVMRANRMAYDLAIKCFVATGVARGDSNDAGNLTLGAGYEAKAREAFDIASALGDKLGYSGGRINQDFGLAQAQELPRMVKDKGYLHRALATCKAAHLL